MKPWVVATAATRAHLGPAPSNLGSPRHVDPTRVASEPFLANLARFDEHLYGARGLSLPRWAFYDCAEMTGVIVGHSARADALTPDTRSVFGEPADDARVPLSMLIAVPTLEERHWIVYSLSALRDAEVPQTCTRTLALALSLLEPERVTVVTQWRSESLALHLAYGPLEVLAAWLPMHDEPASGALSYRPGTEPASRASELLDVLDDASLVALQRVLERGMRAWVVSPPCRSLESLDVPLRFEPGRAAVDPPAAPSDEGPLDHEVARLERLRPFVVATPPHQECFDMAPLGRSIAEAHRFDPLHTRSAPFLARLERLDRLAFGPEGMPMPRWLFFDGAELPGAIVGLGIAVEALDEAQRRFLEIGPAEESGLVPLAMYIAIPMLEAGAFFGHNLASVGRQLPGAPLRGLGSLAKAIGLATLRCTKQLGATQWDSAALHVHTRLGPLELITAWTPAHSEPWTLTYSVDIDEDGLWRLAGGSAPEAGEAERWIERDDHRAMRELQEELEAGAGWAIVGRPSPRGLPLARRTSHARISVVSGRSSS